MAKRGRPKKAVVKAETAIALVEEPKLPVAVDAESLIARAIDKNLPIESMERLLTMRRELKEEWAKEQYFKALAKFQKMCPEIKKTKVVLNENGTIRYKYAPLESIVAQVKELLDECGFSYVLKPKQTETEFVAVCIAHHKDGHEEVTEFAVPLGAEKYMTEVQKVGARNTFAKRYAFCNAFGIMTGDEDTDALEVNGKKNVIIPKWRPEVERPVTPVDPKQEMEVAYKRLLALYKQMEALKLFTDAELEEKKQQGAAAKDNLNSLTDLFEAWSQETKERQRK